MISFTDNSYKAFLIRLIHRDKLIRSVLIEVIGLLKLKQLIRFCDYPCSIKRDDHGLHGPRGFTQIKTSRALTFND
jgi:hypothetical protein